MKHCMILMGQWLKAALIGTQFQLEGIKLDMKHSLSLHTEKFDI